MSDVSDTVRSGNGGSGEPEAYCPACGQSFSPELELCPNDRARLIKIVEKVDPLIGRVFEKRYEIRSRLGDGGMGTVYRGWQLSVDREVAIKVIDPKLSSNRGVVKRFLREARLSSRLSQPSIVNVYDFGQTEDGILYIVMELLRGHTLARELESRRAFPLERVLHIAVQLCDALDAAHKQGIIHRDLKPANVVILDDPPGRDLVKVLDFGLAKSLVGDELSRVTHTDTMLGTPLYMSPEQIEGHPSDQRADLYSLGCMLHEMVSGVPAFAAATVNGVLSKHLYEMAAPLPGGLKESVADLILRLIAKHADERPSSAAEVRAAILGELGQTSVLSARVMAERPSVRRPERTTGDRKPLGGARSGAELDRGGPAVAAPSVGTSSIAPQRRRWLFGLAALVAFAGLVTAIVVSVQRKRPITAPSTVPMTADDAATPGDAAASAADTAAVDARGTPDVVPLDARRAGPPVDARRVAPRPDAVPRSVDAARPAVAPDAAPRPIDAAPRVVPMAADADLDFYRPDAAP